MKKTLLTGFLLLAYPSLASAAIFPTSTSLSTDLLDEITVITGILGIPDPNQYLADFQSLYQQIPLSTDLSPSSVSLASLLSQLGQVDSNLLLDIVLDGNVLYNDSTETVIPPFALEDTYFRLGMAQITTQGGIELGLSEEAQQTIDDQLTQASTSYSDSQTLSNDAQTLSNDSKERPQHLNTYQQSIKTLANRSQNLAQDSQGTDTSFQILRNISGQLSYEAEQNENLAAQNAQLGQILANTSRQMGQQSGQFTEQQETATQLLETAKQQQILQAMSATTSGEQLKLLTESTTEQRRLSNAGLRQLQSGAGVLLMPMVNQNKGQK